MTRMRRVGRCLHGHWRWEFGVREKSQKRGFIYLNVYWVLPLHQIVPGPKINACMGSSFLWSQANNGWREISPEQRNYRGGGAKGGVGPGGRQTPCARGPWGPWGCASTPAKDVAWGGPKWDMEEGGVRRTPERTAAMRRLEAGELRGMREEARAVQGGGGTEDSVL